MNRNQIKYQLESGVESTKSSILPLLSAFSGYVFLGKKNRSREDGSFTSTCWLTFFYFPVAPLDTYRIRSYDGGLFPKIFGVDDYIPYDRTKIDFDYIQVFSSFLVVWVPIFSVVFFLFIYPTFGALGVLVAVCLFSAYQIAKKPGVQPTAHNSISDLRQRLEKGPEVVVAPPQVLPPPVPVQTISVPTPPKQAMPSIASKPAKILAVPKPPGKTKVPQPLAKQVPQTPKTPIPLSSGIGKFANFAVSVPQIIHEEDRARRRGGLILLGILNIALVFAYVFCYGYFSITPEVTGYTAWVYKAYMILNRAHLISLITFNFGLAIFLFRSKLIGFILIASAVALFFNLDAQLWAYLFDCCL